MSPYKLLVFTFPTFLSSSKSDLLKTCFSFLGKVAPKPVFQTIRTNSYLTLVVISKCGNKKCKSIAGFPTSKTSMSIIIMVSLLLPGHPITTPCKFPTPLNLPITLQYKRITVHRQKMKFQTKKRCIYLTIRK